MTEIIRSPPEVEAFFASNPLRNAVYCIKFSDGLHGAYRYYEDAVMSGNGRQVVKVYRELSGARH